jgi:hypothetical protein
MRRKLFECTACHRRFETAQGLFGHLRHCRYHRLKTEAKAEAGNQPPGHNQSEQHALKPGFQGNTTESASRRGGRDSQEHLLLLLDVYEVFPELKRKCLDYAAICRLLGSVRPEMTRVEEWVSLYWILDESERDYEQMVLRLRLDRTILFQLYRQLSVVKQRWLTHLSNDFDAQTGSHPEEIHERQVSAWDEERICGP